MRAHLLRDAWSRWHETPPPLDHIETRAALWVLRGVPWRWTCALMERLGRDRDSVLRAASLVGLVRRGLEEMPGGLRPMAPKHWGPGWRAKVEDPDREWLVRMIGWRAVVLTHRKPKQAQDVIWLAHLDSLVVAPERPHACVPDVRAMLWVHPELEPHHAESLECAREASRRHRDKRWLRDRGYRRNVRLWSLSDGFRTNAPEERCARSWGLAPTILRVAGAGGGDRAGGG